MQFLQGFGPRLLPEPYILQGFAPAVLPEPDILQAFTIPNFLKNGHFLVPCHDIMK